MATDNTNKSAMPVAPLKIAALESCTELGRKVSDHIAEFRKDAPKKLLESPLYSSYQRDDYLIGCSCPRFGTGEAKGILWDSIRGTDLFIMVDVCNYALTYTVCGHENHMSPDDHFQDLKRVISAVNGKAHRINVIMPFLYGERQHKRSQRESLDCALALQELVNMGVSNIITFDTHDPRVQNAIPLHGFDSFNPPYQFTRALLNVEPELVLDRDHTVIISPDEGAMDRAVYLSNVMNVSMGMFYKRKSYASSLPGESIPGSIHQFLGSDVKGKDVIIIDDMISSGQTVLETARQMKEFGANKVFVCVTFGLFTDGFAAFDEYYNKGYIDRVITTNLTYLPPEALEKPYFSVADMSKFIALIIDAYNHDESMSQAMDPTSRIHNYLEKLRD